MGPVPPLRKKRIWDRSQTRIGTSHYNLVKQWQDKLNQNSLSIQLDIYRLLSKRVSIIAYKNWSKSSLSKSSDLVKQR